ncbi:MAG TPA: sulfotransferase [Caulobacteraceae bacterium]|nr:sulfotransferase [Caulobacteraceae bacterium]
MLGRTAEALATWRALAAEPAISAEALAGAAILAPEAITDDELALLRSAAAAETGSARIALPFALGSVLEARGEDEAAFETFAEGNARKRASLTGRFAPAAVAAENARSARLVTDTFNADFIARRAGRGARSSAPIFIVGFPRSGSTLIERILAAHPEVQALGETGVVGAVLDPAWRAGLAGADFVALAATCLEAERGAGWSRAPRFNDKTLENYLHVGAIALMFPSAVIIESRRDPVEACLSCWRELFAADAETLYDFADIGAEYRRYAAVMAHWRAALPGRVVAVDHEALVAEPKAQTRRLVTEVCGLSWDPACLRFFEAGGPVRTASAAQVRRPLFRREPRRRRWAARIGTLLEALGELA